MDQSQANDQFVQSLTVNQNRIYGYVFSLLGDHDRTADVMQETNMVLWRKIDEYQLNMPFLPWAFAIARYQVLAHLRDRKRDRLLLDSDLVEMLSEEVERKAEQIDAIRIALRQCVNSLSPSNRLLIEQRYTQGMSVKTVAEVVNRSVGSIKVALMRIRGQLAKCVQQRLVAES